MLARADLAQLVGERVQLRRKGRDFWGCCPFHDEKTPSFKVDANEHYFKCFGCGAAGNALGFLMENDRLSFPEAVEALAAYLGMEVPREGGDDPAASQHLHNLRRVMEQSAEWFRAQLQVPGNPAIAYLKKRGVDQQTAEKFGLGFVPEGWDGLYRQVGGTAEKDKLLAEAGMLVRKEDGGGYDRFRGRLMFPIRDHRGRTIAFGGRVLGDGEPKYLNSPESPLFHKSEELYGLYEAREADRRLERLLVVEGYMDVIALAQNGIPWAIATLGTALTDQHLRKLFRIVPEVVFCFDGDNAGRAAARKALEASASLLKEGLQARFLILPPGEDPDSMVRAEGTEKFAERVKAAYSFSAFVFEDARQGNDTDALEGRARYASRVRELANKVPDEMLSLLILRKLEEETGLTDRLVPAARAQSQPGRARDFAPPEKLPPSRSARNARTSHALMAVRCLLRMPALAAKWTDPVNLDMQDDNQQLLGYLLEWLGEDASRPHAWLVGRAAGVSSRMQALLIEQLEQDLLLQPGALDAEFRGIMRKLSAESGDQVRKNRLRELQSRSRERPLSAEEMNELQELIRLRQSPTADAD